MPKLIITRKRITSPGYPQIILAEGKLQRPESALFMREAYSYCRLSGKHAQLLVNKVFTFLSWTKNYFSFDRKLNLLFLLIYLSVYGGKTRKTELDVEI